MPEPKQLSAAIVAHIAQELKIPLKAILATLSLFADGGTVPFIARYRKEATGNLDEVATGAIQERAEYFRELDDRRKTVLNSIEEQGRLTPELMSQIESVLDRNVLEDLYLPFKPKRRTKATIAKERGLEPLAAYLWAQVASAIPLVEYAASFVNLEKAVHRVDEALEGARHIVAEQISETAEFRSTYAS